MSQELDDARFREYMRMLEAEQARTKHGSVDTKTQQRLSKELDTRIKQSQAKVDAEEAYAAGDSIPFTEPPEPVKKVKAVIERRLRTSEVWEPISVHDSYALAEKQLPRKSKDRRYEFRVREL